MSTSESLLKAVESLNTTQEQFNKNLSELFSQSSSGGKRAHGPFARSGESSLTSRGYQLSRIIGTCSNKMDADQCKVEQEVHEKLQKAMSALGYVKAESKSILVPFSTSHILSLDPQFSGLATELKQLMAAGVAGVDVEELHGLRTKALSWNETENLGALVGPPQFGELIDLLRNNEVFMRAGARVLPMPPNGRIVYPRQTNATTANWVGEAETVDLSYPKTGDLVMTAKKLGIRTRIPNELFRFASVSVEQFVREDLMKVAALKLDKTLLEHIGSAVTPKGLLNYSGISSYTASTVGANGNTLEPEDILQIVGTVEEQNATFKAWVGRPLMYAALANRRADATTPGDAKGMFLFNMLRDLQSQSHDVTREGMGSLAGYPFFKSTQVGRDRTKGSATNLSYILGGDFSQFLLALSGVLELMANPYGDTAFSTDQTEIRGIMFADGVPMREAAFVKVDELIVA